MSGVNSTSGNSNCCWAEVAKRRCYLILIPAQYTRLLDEVDDYYRFVKEIGWAFQELAKTQDGRGLDDHELLLCVVGYLGQPPGNWAGEKYLHPYLPAEKRKTPGMSYVLVSEFMRNLGWNGFKPDRHVQRLFNRWFPDGPMPVLPKVERLAALIGRNSKGLNNYLTYSLIGAGAVREGEPLSQVDNLVWLLGAYVERKGRESGISYLKRSVKAR